MKKYPKGILEKYTLRNESEWKKFIQDPNNINYIIGDLKDISKMLYHYETLLQKAYLQEENDQMIIEDLRHALKMYKDQMKKELQEALDGYQGKE